MTDWKNAKWRAGKATADSYDARIEYLGEDGKWFPMSDVGYMPERYADHIVADHNANIWLDARVEVPVCGQKALIWVRGKAIEATVKRGEHDGDHYLIWETKPEYTYYTFDEASRYRPLPTGPEDEG